MRETNGNDIIIAMIILPLPKQHTIRLVISFINRSVVSVTDDDNYSVDRR